MNATAPRLLGSLLLLVCASGAQAQESRPAKAEDAAWHNKVMDAFMQALPQSFRDWDTEIPVMYSQREAMKPGDLINYCEGSLCERSDHYELSYSGEGLRDEYFAAGQAKVATFTPGSDQYVHQIASVMSDFYSNRILEVKIYANLRNTRDLPYCKNSGVQKPTPPAGWTAWYSGSAISCIDKDEILDVNVISMGALPGYSAAANCTERCQGTVKYGIDEKQYSSFKIHNIVMVLRGSKAITADYLSKIDTQKLKALLQ